jgi:hypothetical protein
VANDELDVAAAIVAALAPISGEPLRESARAFARRWPGLGEDPHVAPAAFRRAASWWGRSLPTALEAAPPPLASLDPEIELVASGAKPACLKESVPAGEVDDLLRAYRLMGLTAGVADFHAWDPSGLHREGAALALVAVAADAPTLARVLEAQRAHAKGGGAAPIEAMGALMGYPACCVRAFAAQESRRDNAENERLTFRRGPGEGLPPELHRLGRFALVGHHPCTPSCAPSSRLAEAILACVAALDAATAELLRARLATPVLLVDLSRRAEVEGRWVGDELVVDRFTPLDGAVFPVEGRDVARIVVSRTAVGLVLRGGARIEVEADRPLLSTPGAPLAPAALEAIGGPLVGSRAAPPLPELPASFRPGARVRGYRITAVRRVGEEVTIDLSGPEHRFLVQIRACDPARAWTIRRGPWAVDVEGATTLPDGAREALALLVRALPE